MGTGRGSPGVLAGRRRGRPRPAGSRADGVGNRHLQRHGLPVPALHADVVPARPRGAAAGHGPRLPDHGRAGDEGSPSSTSSPSASASSCSTPRSTSSAATSPARSPSAGSSPHPTSYFRDNSDAAAIADMTRAVMANRDIDAERVYIVGVSAGGLMAAVEAAAYPDLFAAVGLVASAGYADGPASRPASASRSSRAPSSRSSRWGRAPASSRAS